MGAALATHFDWMCYGQQLSPSQGTLVMFGLLILQFLLLQSILSFLGAAAPLFAAAACATATAVACLLPHMNPARRCTPPRLRTFSNQLHCAGNCLGLMPAVAARPLAPYFCPGEDG